MKMSFEEWIGSYDNLPFYFTLKYALRGGPYDGWVVDCSSIIHPGHYFDVPFDRGICYGMTSLEFDSTLDFLPGQVSGLPMQERFRRR